MKTLRTTQRTIWKFGSASVNMVLLWALSGMARRVHRFANFLTSKIQMYEQRRSVVHDEEAVLDRSIRTYHCVKADGEWSTPFGNVQVFKLRRVASDKEG